MRYVPKFIRHHLRALPQWSAIAVPQPQELVCVKLVVAGAEFDVTRNHVIAALKPLTIAIGLDAPLRRALEGGRGPTLSFMDRHTDRTIGSLRLKCASIPYSRSQSLGLFDIAGADQRCVRWPYRGWNRWLQARAARKNTNPNNFSMTAESQQWVMIFYVCPRPVVLVSVDDGRHSNIFPMDLIGPLSPDVFTLALRSTSQSVDAMKSTRRVALSDIAASDVTIAHALGAHHKKMQVDWGALPFAVQRSELFSLPVPAIALRVREVEIVDFEAIGSHTFFVCRIVSEKALRDGVQLCHTSGMYQHFRVRHQLPLQPAQG